MNLRQFIKKNRNEIDSVIKRYAEQRINDTERELWILNDESLYSWAKRSGVKI